MVNKITCKCCGKQPNEILEYKLNCEDMSADEFVTKFEGTYNPKTRKFYCTECYIKLGMPSGKA